jgi:HD superfamily phosphohydrolase YqeK
MSKQSAKELLNKLNVEQEYPDLSPAQQASIVHDRLKRDQQQYDKVKELEKRIEELENAHDSDCTCNDCNDGKLT